MRTHVLRTLGGAVVLGMAAAGNCWAMPELVLPLDPSQLDGRPLLKSKLGMARATGFDQLPRSVAFLRDVGARTFCSTVAFDDIEDRGRPNHALQGTRFTADGVAYTAQPSVWFDALQQALAAQGIQPYIGLVGTPEPYRVAVIRKPAEHPTPLNIDATARLMAAWAQPWLSRYPSTHWVIWNEPEHALRGNNSVAAAQDMAQIYRSYRNAMDGLSPYDRFGLAAFMKASLKPTLGEPQRNFFQSVLDRTVQPQGEQPAATVDFISMNNYHGRMREFLNMMAAEMARRGMDQPLLFSQFAPWQIGEQADLVRSNRGAGFFVEALDELMFDPSLSHVCMSHWSGPERKNLLRWDERRQQFESSSSLAALALYQRMNLWRVHLPEAVRTSPVQVLASADHGQLSVLLMNLPRSDSTPTEAGSQDRKARERAERKAENKALRQALRHGDTPPADSADTSPPPAPPAPPPADPTAPRTVVLQLAGAAGQSFVLDRLADGQSLPQRSQLSADAQGRLSLNLAAREIVLLRSGAGEASPALRWPGRLIGHDLYMHRQGPNQQALPREQQGTAGLDPFTDGMVLEVPGPQATAHGSMLLQQVPNQAELVLKLPPGRDLASVADCAAVVLRHQNQGQALDALAWGAPATLARLAGSRHLNGVKLTPVSRLDWRPGANHQALLRLDLAHPAPPQWDTQRREVRLHLALGACPQPAMAAFELRD